jgi:hypothetical protein
MLLFDAGIDYRSCDWSDSVPIGDLNRDGVLDLDAACHVDLLEDGGVAVLLANGDGTFQSAVDYGFSLPNTPPGVGEKSSLFLLFVAIRFLAFVFPNSTRMYPRS